MSSTESAPAYGGLVEKAQAQGIRYFLPTYTSLAAMKRGTLIPVTSTDKLMKEGMASMPIDGFDMSITGEEVYCFPDPSTLTQLSWEPEIGWLACDVHYEGKPMTQCPRVRLRTLSEEVKKEYGLVMKTGVEPEFTLLDKEKHEAAFPAGEGDGKFHCPHATMDRRHFLMKLLDNMDQLGWKPFQGEKEGFSNQYEVGFGYADAMVTADRTNFFKFMAKELAKEGGFRVTFMPQPFNVMSISSLHLNISLWEGDRNVFVGEGRLGVSKTAEHFIAGVLKHAEALCAFVCPTVNSYKRVCNSWCVSTVSYGKFTRAPMIRIPTNDRIEFRLPDGSANVHLVHAATLAAGMDGIKHKMELEPNEELKMHDNSTVIAFFGGQFKAPAGMRTLPGTLKDALDALEANTMFPEVLGKELVKSYIKMKTQWQWDPYCKAISKWEEEQADNY